MVPDESRHAKGIGRQDQLVVAVCCARRRPVHVRIHVAICAQIKCVTKGLSRGAQRPPVGALAIKPRRAN